MSIKILSKEDTSMRPLRGTVKWFDAKKGHGFIDPEEGDQEIFVHHSGIRGAEIDSLNAGDQVEFDVVSDEAEEGGIRAVNVVRV
jgi:CspA family cold shock protein